MHSALFLCVFVLVLYCVPLLVATRPEKPVPVVRLDYIIKIYSARSDGSRPTVHYVVIKLR